LTVALLAALVAVNIAYIWRDARKDARHDAQVNRLIHWAQSPQTAAVEQVARPSDGPLYVNPEHAEQAWLKQLVAEG
jgi:hypothetical protein